MQRSSFDLNAILHCSQVINTLSITTFDFGPHRHRTGCYNKFVIGIRIKITIIKVSNFDLFVFPINFYNFMVNKGRNMTLIRNLLNR